MSYNSSITLSKSDFQLASSCPKKLVYKKAKYPTTNDTNEYMKLLAQGGYIIGKMATLYYPDGIEIEGNTSECLAKTSNYFKEENIVLFEAAIQAGQKLVRTDILIKNGKKLHLIEVKAKSHDTDANPSDSKKNLKEYIEDVAYQYCVLKEAFPDYDISCSLFMPDKAKRTSIDGLAGWFSIEKTAKTDNQNDDIPAQETPRFQKPKVVFKYEDHHNRKKYTDQLIDDGILSELDVTEDVLQMQTEISQRAEKFLRILNEGIDDADYAINKSCKACEFRTPGEHLDGFRECWGDLGYKDDHIFDLFFGGSIGHYTKGYYLDELIAEERTSLFDIDIDRLKNVKGIIEKRGLRQLIQIRQTELKAEWISEELNAAKQDLQYPLHFIDFETYTGAVPYHAGMRPYELIAFQWSCHTINKPGDIPLHKEWIHTGPMFDDAYAFPNFEFARSLMQHIGNSGTPFMWASHENTVLRTILEQMETFRHEDEQLKNWLTDITRDDKNHREGRLIDMNQMTIKYYFHPFMKGRTSIKKVLPAIWTNFPYLHRVPQFSDYAPDKLSTETIDPYDTLKARTESDETEEDVVSQGTDAMRAYQRIRFDSTLTEEQRKEIRRQLLEYCKLDTMAMVIIAYHWGIK